MKIVIAPDSFKGTLHAHEVARIIKDSFTQLFKEKHFEAMIETVPIADGGEGTSSVLLENLGGRRITHVVTGPEGQDVEASYAIINNSAVIEVAESSGLKLCNQADTKTTTSFGLGQLILDALDHEVNEIIICLGGSGTTDGGTGMAAALGVAFITNQQKIDLPCGENLEQLELISLVNMDPRIAKVSFKILSDVNNPLYGKQGAAFIYGPQKGATHDDVLLLDKGLRHYGDLLQQTFHKDCSSFPGAGAAGGLGAGCFAFLDAQILPGIETLLHMIQFDKRIQDADIIITGEGQIDEQSFMGKAISGIIKNASHKRVYVICGDNACSEDCMTAQDIKIFAATDYCRKDDSLNHPEEALKVVSEACASHIYEITKK